MTSSLAPALVAILQNNRQENSCQLMLEEYLFPAKIQCWLLFLWENFTIIIIYIYVQKYFEYLQEQCKFEAAQTALSPKSINFNFLTSLVEQIRYQYKRFARAYFTRPKLTFISDLKA